MRERTAIVSAQHLLHPEELQDVREALRVARGNSVAYSSRRELLASLKSELAEPGAFERLPLLLGEGHNRLRIVEQNGKKAVLKLCEDRADGHHYAERANRQGYDIQGYANAIKAYWHRVGSGEVKPEKHVIVNLRSFGRFEIGSRAFLLMEHIEQPDQNKLKPEETRLKTEGLKELVEQSRANPGRTYWEIPQALDSIHVGFTKGSEHLQPKVILAFPFDWI